MYDFLSSDRITQPVFYIWHRRDISKDEIVIYGSNGSVSGEKNKQTLIIIGAVIVGIILIVALGNWGVIACAVAVAIYFGNLKQKKDLWNAIGLYTASTCVKKSVDKVGKNIKTGIEESLFGGNYKGRLIRRAYYHLIHIFH